MEERRESGRSAARKRRLAIVAAPAGLPPGAPLVLVFHGSGMTGEEIRPYLFFDDLADLQGFAVAYPDGLERGWNGCRKSAPFAANRRAIDDVGFVRALVRRLADRLAIDPARVFAVGVSGGGHMALRLALEAPDAVAGVAALGANLPAPDELDCAPAGEAVPLLLLARTADRINPYGGGRVVLRGLGDLGVVLSARETAEYFRRLAGHAAPPERLDYPDVNPGDGSRIEGWTWRAPRRVEVTLLAVHGGGHPIPHPTVVTPERFGPTNADIEAAAEIWAFFRRQLPAR